MQTSTFLELLMLVDEMVLGAYGLYQFPYFFDRSRIRELKFCKYCTSSVFWTSSGMFWDFILFCLNLSSRSSSLSFSGHLCHFRFYVCDMLVLCL